MDKALHLFWAHGYEGTSIALLAQEIGVNVPSLYAAFGNKEALFLQAVEHYGQLNGGMYHDAFAKPTAQEVARAVLEGEVELITRPQCPDGCLMVQGALVTSPESEKIRTLMAEMRSVAERWMADRFRKAQEDGDLPAHANSEALACYIMTLNCGLAVQAKSGAGKEQLMRVVEIAMANWPSP